MGQQAEGVPAVVSVSSTAGSSSSSSVTQDGVASAVTLDTTEGKAIADVDVPSAKEAELVVETSALEASLT